MAAVFRSIRLKAEPQSRRGREPRRSEEPHDASEPLRHYLLGACYGLYPSLLGWPLMFYLYDRDVTAHLGNDVEIHSHFETK